MSFVPPALTGVDADFAGPTSQFYFSQRLRLHYVDWGNDAAPPLLMIHGGRDHCRNWDWVAREMRRDYHIVAPDLRGHGDSEWVIGAGYHQADFVYDIAQLVHQKQLSPVTIVAHSLGGAIALRFAGLFPELVKKLVVIEGLGPSPDLVAERAQIPPEQSLLSWIEAMRRASGRTPRRYATLEDACRRMQEENERLTPEQARHLTLHGVNQNEDGTFSWKFDNYVRIGAPGSFDVAESHHLWSRIACPTLLIRGTESGRSDPIADGRAAHFTNAHVVAIDGAGHWVHHDKLSVFLELIRGFLDGPSAE